MLVFLLAYGQIGFLFLKADAVRLVCVQSFRIDFLELLRGVVKKIQAKLLMVVGLDVELGEELVLLLVDGGGLAGL